MKRSCLFLLLFISLFFVACSQVPSSSDYGNCDICQKSFPNDDSWVYTDKHGAVCFDCALSPEFTICHGCGEFSDYGWYEYEVDYGYCYDCSQEYLRQCGICEEGLFVKSNMVHFPGYYVCGNCAYQIALNFDTESEVFQYIDENNVFYPE